MKHGCRVIKLGGSLLEWPGWQAQLRVWIALQTLSTNVILFGGGARVAVLRGAWAAGEWDDKAAHWQAISAMSDNLQAAAADFPQWTLVDQLDVIRAGDRGRGSDGRGFDGRGFDGRTWLFDPGRHLVEEDIRFPAGPLPEAWEVTSDSIAARICQCLGADELVLLKSCLPDAASRTRVAWAEAGYVDPFFPRAAICVQHVRCVDLRSSGFPSICAE